MPTIDPATALALSDLKARYFTCLDAKRWSDLAEIFTPNARFEGFAFDAAGRDGFVATVSAFLADVRSQHAGYMPRFAPTADPLRVRGAWLMHDYLTWEPDSRAYKGVSTPGMHGLRGWGQYEEEYTYVDGRWFISFSRLTRTRIDALVGEPPVTPDYDVVLPDPSWLSPVAD